MSVKQGKQKMVLVSKLWSRRRYSNAGFIGQAASWHAVMLMALTAGACGVLLAPGAQPGLAQQNDDYESLPYDATQRRNLNIPRYLRGDKPLEGNEEEFKEFFNKLIFAEMTKPENINTIPELRQTFYKRYLWQGRDEKAFKFLNEHTLDMMRKLVSDKFHPAVRYNAVLIMGDLDSAPRDMLRGDVKPTPWPGAVPTLVACIERPAFPDFIRAGALVGLQRHTALGVSTEVRDEVLRTMYALIQQKDPPAGRDREVHDWMRRRACEMLADIGQTGGSNEIPKALIVVMNDPKASLSLRCVAAQSLGKLRYDGATGIDTKALANGMGDLVVIACDDVRQRVKDLGAQNARRQVAAYLSRVKSGLVAPAKLGQPDELALAKDLNAQVDATLKMLTSASDATALADNLNRVGQDILTRMGKAAPEATTPVTAETPMTEDTASPGEKPATESTADPFGKNPFE